MLYLEESPTLPDSPQEDVPIDSAIPEGDPETDHASAKKIDRNAEVKHRRTWKRELFRR